MEKRTEMNFHVIMTCSDLVIPRVIEYSSTHHSYHLHIQQSPHGDGQQEAQYSIVACNKAINE